MRPSPYRYSVYGTPALSEHTSPTVRSSTQRTLTDGNTVYLTCQAAGSDVHGSTLWDKLTNGGWIPDYFVDTSNVGTFSYPVPPC